MTPRKPAVSLADLKPGMTGRIRAFDEVTGGTTLLGRLMEMGMTVGATVEVAFAAPFGGAIAVRLRGSLIALRLSDARSIEVETP